MRKFHLKSHHKHGLIAGAITALSLAIVHSQIFKPYLLEPPWLITYYMVSLLIGGAAGFVAAFLVRRIPLRLLSAVSCIVGAFFGALVYYWQVYLLLLFIFRKYPTSF